MTAHTPTPWVNGFDHNGDPEFIFGGGAVIADCGFFSDAATNVANVAFVLNAVNSHDALVKALKNARNCIHTLIVNSPDKKKRRNLGEFIREIDNALNTIKEDV